MTWQWWLLMIAQSATVATHLVLMVKRPTPKERVGASVAALSAALFTYCVWSLR